MSKEIERVEIVDPHVVQYTQPKFLHRIIANFVDIFIFVLTGVLLFAATRCIVVSTDSYKQMDARYDEIRLDSGLYMKNPSDDSEIIDTIGYLTNNVQTYGKDFDGYDINQEDFNLNKITTHYKISTAVTAINIFRDYIAQEGVLDNEVKVNLLNAFDQEYKKIRLETLYNGTPLFIEESGLIKPNPVISEQVSLRSLYFDNVYSKFLDNYCLGFLSSNVEEYYTITKNFAVLVLALEVPVAYVLSAILTYFVPPLFFKRGRKTLGKALYHIGLIDTKTILSPSLGKFTIRFLIFLFGELLLSVVTLGLPYLISASMMAFSKKKQGFPDYMVGCIEVDTSKNNIFLDYIDAELKEGLHGKPIDFKMRKPF